MNTYKTGLLEMTRPNNTKAALRIRVRLHGERQVFGRTEVEIEPVAGEGRLWVHAAALTDIREEKDNARRAKS